MRGDSFCCFIFHRQGEMYCKPSSFSYFACDFDLAAMGDSKALHQRQAKASSSAGPVAGFVHPIKTVEYVRQVILQEYLCLYLLIATSASPPPAFNPTRTVSSRIRYISCHFQEVEENLFQSHPVASDIEHEIPLPEREQHPSARASGSNCCLISCRNSNSSTSWRSR